MSEPRLPGLTLSKQYPNPAEPVRGLFVEQQVLATASAVDWTVIAPVPWAPGPIRARVGRPDVVASETRAGIDVAHPSYVAGPGKLGYSLVWRFMRDACRPAFDAAAPHFVHAHALYPVGTAALALAEKRAIPVIVSIHGSDLYEALATPALRAHARRTAERAAAIVCVSDALAADVERELGVPADRIRVIPDAYDDGTFSYIERGALHAPVRIATVARLERVKGIDVLVEALAHLNRSGVAVDAVAIGGGSMEGLLRERAVALGISDAIRFAGPLGPDGIVAELAGADLYVQPSRREGFGVALVEALATGLPAVATDSGGPGSIIDDANGVLVDPGNPSALAAGIRAALKREWDGRAIAESTRQRYARAAVGARLVELYREVRGGAAS